MRLEGMTSGEMTAYVNGMLAYEDGVPLEAAKAPREPGLRRCFRSGWLDLQEQHATAQADPDRIDPGEWLCDRCGFRLHKRLLDVQAGAVGIDQRLHREECPNDGELMRQATMRDSDPGPPGSKRKK